MKQNISLNKMDFVNLLGMLIKRVQAMTDKQEKQMYTNVTFIDKIDYFGVSIILKDVINVEVGDWLISLKTILSSLDV